MKINIICKVCYKEIEAQFTADETNDEINLFVVPCKQCAAQQNIDSDAVHEYPLRGHVWVPGDEETPNGV